MIILKEMAEFLKLICLLRGYICLKNKNLSSKKSTFPEQLEFVRVPLNMSSLFSFYVKPEQKLFLLS